MRFSYILMMCLVALGAPLFAKTITIKVTPANAQIIKLNPSNPALNQVLGTGTAVVKLKSKETMQVRADLAGFVSSRIVRLDKDTNKNLELLLSDWIFKIEASPSDAEIFRDNISLGFGKVDTVIARGEKVQIELRKPGFKTEQLPVLANLPGNAPPIAAKLGLTQWSIQLNSPTGSLLFNNGAPFANPMILANGAKAKIRMEKDGFAPKEFDFQNNAGSHHPGPAVDLKFDRRLVLVTARSPGAQISTIPPQMPVSTGTKTVEIDRDSCVEVRVTMPGHELVTRRYCFLDGEAEPPIKDVIDALRPAVQIRVTSPMGTRIFVDGIQVGTQTATVPLPDNVENTCYTLRIEKPGFATLEELHCDNTPLIQRELRDRILSLSASPTTADIVVDGRKVGTGSAEVKVNDQQKISVRAQSPGFVSSTPLEFENKAGVLSPPQASVIQLVEDPAFKESISASDQANINFTIEVNPEKEQDDAWKLISLIVLNNFDVIEVTDKESGYIRSAWEVKDFGATQVRTRLIVKLGDISPLKYVIKIVSEHGEKPPPSAPIGSEVKFSEFPRLLPKYKDIINEMTFRLR